LIQNHCMRRKLWMVMRLAALVMVAAGVATGVARGQDAAGVHVVELNEEAALGRRVQYVAPEYPPMARAAKIEGVVKLRARIASDGTVMSLELVSGHPLLVRAALEAAKQWRYWPLGERVQALTTVSVEFSLAAEAGKSAATNPTPVSRSRAVTIRLNNGRAIQADAVQEVGDKLEYTIGEGEYKISKSLVEEVTHAAGVAAANSSQAGALAGNASSNTLAAANGGAKNWYLYESTEQLRDECRSGVFAQRWHAEFQSESEVKRGDTQKMCAVFAVDMGGDYEAMVERGLELDRELCAAGGGRMPQMLLPQPADIKAKAEELAKISTEFMARMKEFLAARAEEPGKAQRSYLDMYRLMGTCGHGMG
jgi:TonB family protein